MIDLKVKEGESVLYPDVVLQDMANRFSPRTWALLMAVERENGAMVVTVEKSVTFSGSGFRRELSYLEGAQAVRVYESPQDGRAKCVDLTDNGRRLLSAFQPS